jgi:PKD repeat protein
MERIASIMLLAICVVGTGYLYMEHVDRLAADEAAAAVVAEEAATAAAAAEVEAAKVRFTIPHDKDPSTTDITVSLDGSGSFDTEGDSLSFYWDQTSGDLVYLESADNNTTTFIATPGEYTFKLTVSDSYGSSTSDNTTISVAQEPNSPPEVVVKVY